MKITDPLAQSFYVEAESGIFVTSVDLYFYSRDVQLPVTVQLRPVKYGNPTSEVYPFSEVVLDPKEVFISETGTVPTTVYFPSPVYLTGQEFHSIAILSSSPDYSVWISRLGEFDTNPANILESQKVLVSKQPLSGSLFKSQNGSTWTASQFEDLKFNLYRANFKSNGNINFYNSQLQEGNDQIATLSRDPLTLSSKKIRVGLGTTLAESQLPSLGNKIIQSGNNSYGIFVGYAGSGIGNLNIINAGIGYTPSSSSSLFTGVNLRSVTGDGNGATANITITNGVAVAATFNSGGSGYKIGDVLTAPIIGINSLGRNLRLSVTSLSGINEIIIDQVQGDFTTGVGKTIRYINNIGIATDLKNTGANVLADTITTVSDGLHIKIKHRNHGMHFSTNKVELSDVEPDSNPVKLTSSLSSTSNTSIDISSSSGFELFENVGVGTTNPGYALIGDEIISYTGTVSGATPQLIGITRSIDGTRSSEYPVGTSIYKYELGSVSLRRINKIHNFVDVTVSDPIDLDYYTIKLDTSTNGVDRSVGTFFPKLYLNQEKSCGGSIIKSTQNIQYEILTPVIQTLSLVGTNISASARTVSGTSVDGTEASFSDKGFEFINLNNSNYLTSPRLICSKINETEKLTSLPGNKSLTVNLELNTSNAYVSPVIDLDRTSVILTTNRINNPIQNYVTDNRVSSLDEDPTAFVYATNAISLETPATSIKVIVSAYVNTYSDVRAFFALMNDPEENPIYYPFPGYDNLTADGTIIDLAANNGRPDKLYSRVDSLGFTSKELTFRDLEFTIDKLSPFRYFSIKLNGTSTTQVYPPRFKQLRVIALA